MEMHEAHQAAEVGMARSAATSGEEWALYARRFVYDYLRSHETMHVDDLWAAGLQEPVSSRGLGQVIKNAAKDGWIEKISSTKYDGVLARPSVNSNMQLKPVWKSLL